MVLRRPGPADRGGPTARWLHGIAWNTPATQQAAQQPRCRHMLGCSRGVGIRLVRDGQLPVSTGELACRHEGMDGRAADRSRPLAEIDEELIRALDASQADGGLGPMSLPAPGNPAMASSPNRSLNPSDGKSASLTNSTPRIGRVSSPAVTWPTVPPVRRASKVR